MPDHRDLNIYIDGSAYNNPGGEGGIMGIAEFPENLNRPPEILFKESYKETTNQRMELRACVKALEYGHKIAKPLGIERVIVMTDSRYVHDNQNNAVYWQKDGWRNKEGRPIENDDLWKKFNAARRKTTVRTEIQWIKGKTSDILNMVDDGAKKAAKNIFKTKDSGYLSGKVSKAMIKSGASTMFPANNQKAAIRIYRKGLMDIPGKREYKIIFELYSEEKNIFIAKYYAYTNEDIEDQLHRSHLYRVQFNGNNKYPKIVEIFEEVFIG